MIALLMLGSLLSAAPLTPTHDTAVEVFIGLSSGAQAAPASFSASTRLGLSRAVNAWFRPELQLMLGAHLGSQLLHTGIRAGARFELPRTGAVPFLGLAFAHQHESAFRDVALSPVSHALGLSEDGVHHRSGLEVSAGLFRDFASATGGADLRVGLRAAAVGLLGNGAPFGFEGLGTLGLLF